MLSVHTIHTTIAPTQGVTEVQRLAITGTATGGTFTMSFGGQTTSAIAYNATAAAVQSALCALSSIGTGGVTCSGGPLPGTAIDITFAGENAGKPQAEMTTTDSLDNANEVQTITLTGSVLSGTFTITFDGETTGNIAHNATAGTVQTALEALSNIGAGNVTVTGGPLASAPFTVTFIGDLADTNVAEMTTTDTFVGRDEVQTIAVTGTVTGGTFTITYDGQTTGAIAYNASAADIDTALEALSNIDAAALTCAGGPLPTTPVTVTFAAGNVDASNVALMTATPSLTHNEVVSLAITGSPTGGTFTMTVGAAGTTAPIAYNADAATVQAALIALDGITDNDVTCTGGALPGTPVVITFVDDLAATNIATITTTDSLTGGTAPASAVTVTNEGGAVGTLAITETTAGYAAGSTAVATGTAGAAPGTTGVTQVTGGVIGSYRGVAPGTYLITSSGVGAIYYNSGTAMTPAWTLIPAAS